ncbi:MAG: hypothetical protein JWM06_2822 [Actinomycetia bacterium]|jgi:hypothetical protein|nr:hypothetical protein [Actinomycetes bacterium]
MAIRRIALLVYASGTSEAATGSFGAFALIACAKRHGASAWTQPFRDTTHHPTPSATVMITTSDGNDASAFLYSSATLAREGEQHYVADMVDMICSRAQAKIRQTCILNIRGETQTRLRYTVANVFVEFPSREPPAGIRGIVASCLHG